MAERGGGSEGGWGSVAPDVERLNRREARQTGGERGGAVGADAVRTAGEQREQKSQREERTGGWKILIM
jgi:hypothetical protein